MAERSVRADAVLIGELAQPRVSRLRWALRTARRKPIGVISLFIILLLIFSALFADAVAPFDPVKTSRETYQSPSARHLFGTDNIGRDIFSRIIHGARISLMVGIISVAIGTAAGSVLGLVSGYLEGSFDLLVQRIVDALQAIPGLILAMALVSVLGPSTFNTFLAIGIILIVPNVRVVRGAVLSVKRNVYVEAAQVTGASTIRILLRHILPNVTAPILILGSVYLGSAILIEASLSFLGLGTQPPNPSWGAMLSQEGRRYMESAPWMAIFPGVAISVTVLAFNLLGDTLRDIWDPRLRGA